MKKTNLWFLLIILLGIGFGITSCEEEGEGDNTETEKELKGEMTADLTLDASVEYELIGALVMMPGTKLTIPAGTRIVASAVTTENPDVRYIAISRGAQIFVNGTADNPVVMTSSVKETESWGGLVMCGAAPQNKTGVSGGESTSEVADLPYGGTNAADNSGSIKYLRVEYTGYKYTNEKEFNGVTFFGVGSGTVVDYVVSYMGGDDGMEFFGGTVNASHLVSVGSGDDGIDFADGYSGTGMFWYILNSAKSGIEGSNSEADYNNNVPMTNAILKNFTVYGMGEKPWFLKEGAGHQNIDNVVIGGLAESKSQSMFFADDSIVDARVTAGDIVVGKVKFVDLKAGQTKAIDGLSFTEDESITGAGNGIGKPDWLSDALNKVDETTNVVE